MKTCSAIASFFLLTLAGSGYAHHSNTPFDMSRMLEASGIVADANFKNPHSSLTLVVDEVIEKLKIRLASLRVGDPLDKNTDVGAINSKMQLKRINEYL